MHEFVKSCVISTYSAAHWSMAPPLLHILLPSIWRAQKNCAGSLVHKITVVHCTATGVWISLCMYIWAIYWYRVWVWVWATGIKNMFQKFFLHKNTIKEDVALASFFRVQQTISNQTSHCYTLETEIRRGLRTIPFWSWGLCPSKNFWTKVATWCVWWANSSQLHERLL